MPDERLPRSWRPRGAFPCEGQSVVGGPMSGADLVALVAGVALGVLLRGAELQHLLPERVGGGDRSAGVIQVPAGTAPPVRVRASS